MTVCHKLTSGILWMCIEIMRHADAIPQFTPCLNKHASSGFTFCNVCYFAVHPMKSVAEIVWVWTKQYGSYIFPVGQRQWWRVRLVVYPTGTQSARCAVWIWTKQYDSYIFPLGQRQWWPMWLVVHPTGTQSAQCAVKWHAASYWCKSVNIN